MDSAIGVGSVSPETVRNVGVVDDDSDTTLQLGYFISLEPPSPTSRASASFSLSSWYQARTNICWRIYGSQSNWDLSEYSVYLTLHPDLMNLFDFISESFSAYFLFWYSHLPFVVQAPDWGSSKEDKDAWWRNTNQLKTQTSIPLSFLSPFMCISTLLGWCYVEASFISVLSFRDLKWSKLWFSFRQF